MNKHQWKGHIFIPVILIFIAIRTVTGWSNQDLNQTTKLFETVLFITSFILIMKWFSKKEIHNFLLGFNPPPTVISLSIKALLLSGLVHVVNWLNPNLHMGNSSVTIIVTMVIGLAYFHYYIEELTTSHTFVRVTPIYYMDLTYNELHTKEEITQYHGEKTLIEDLNIDNLLLIKGYLKPRRQHKYLEVKFEKVTDDIVTIGLYSKNEMVWKCNYKYEKPLNESEIEEIIKRIHTIKRR